MATDFTVFSRRFYKSSPLDSDVKMISLYVVNTAAETQHLVPIPWENVMLVKAVAAVAVAIDATAAMEIDLELNASGGTEMMSITVDASAAVGSVWESTTTTQTACEQLNALDSSRDAICVEVDGSAAAAGAVNLYLYFEPDLG